MVVVFARCSTWDWSELYVCGYGCPFSFTDCNAVLVYLRAEQSLFAERQKLQERMRAVIAREEEVTRREAHAKKCD